MKRVRASQLALVNWKGVFFQVYDLDRHVTALEGANGAGKTTVMIAAYAVLLPDLTRLRFTNLGETGATGGDKGIWGRLGDRGPALAVLRLHIPDGKEILAGVHLARRAEPSVEATPFVITDLAPDVALDDVLLLRQGELDTVPELPELSVEVAKLGGRLQRFPSQKGYFEWLYRAGVTPLDLSGDEERNKFNEMLRTSMTGGMSKGVTAELRAFLLKEHGGLADSLVRMRGNVDACRDTRRLVEDAQQIEHEIAEVLESGQLMFAAAVGATRARFEELTRRVQDAQSEMDRAEIELAGKQRELGEAQSEQAGLVDLLTTARSAADQAKAWLQRVIDANVTTQERVETQAKLAEADENLAQLGAALTASREACATALRRYEDALGVRDRAAAGLADLQEGVQELMRQAGLHRRVVAALATAREHLGSITDEETELIAAMAEARRRLSALDGSRADLQGRIATADHHRRAHGEVVAALAKIARKEPHTEAALDLARQELARLQDADALARQASQLHAAASELEQRLARQTAVRDRAKRLGDLRSAAELRKALTDDEAELLKAQEAHQRADLQRADAQRQSEGARLARAKLEKEQARWLEVSNVATRLEETWEVELRDAAGLRELRTELDRRRADAHESASKLTEDRDKLINEAADLRASGGAFTPELLAARDTVAGELLAGRFEHVSVEEAATVEALLGPLAEAIVVDDVQAAAAALVQASKMPETLWLVDAGEDRIFADDGRLHGEVRGNVALVTQNTALRLTRLPPRPTLGKAARAKRIAELDARAERLGDQAASHAAEKRRAEAALHQSELVLQEIAVFEAGDRDADLRAAQMEVKRWSDALRQHHQEAESAAVRAAGLRPRVTALRDLLQDAALLDEPDLAERSAAARSAYRDAVEAGKELQRVAAWRRLVAERIDVLQRVPDDAATMAQLREQLKEHDSHRAALTTGVECLEQVLENIGALGWHDAQQRLSAREPLVPALKLQLSEAVDAAKLADKSRREAEAAVDECNRTVNKADAEQKAIAAELARIDKHLDELNVADPSTQVVDQARERLRRADAAADQVTRRDKELAGILGRLQALVDNAEEASKRAADQVGKAQRDLQPARDQWLALQEGARAAGVLAAAEALAGHRALATLSGSVQWYMGTQQHAAVLLERLGRSKDSAVFAGELVQLVGTQEQHSSDAYLRAWLAVRDWLCQRVPAQIAEFDDPIEALVRLRQHLGDLVARLALQEKALRGHSGDVAQAIQVQVRKAQGQIRKLNKDLEGIRFGSIRGIRIHVRPDEQMSRVLEALREGPTQVDLFAQGVTIEQALDDLMRRYAGRTGGQRLLDYREYMGLRVEVRRQTSDAWEEANSVRLSTGEAIGVGAALMMVVLTAWETDARLLGARRSAGTLRLLFLDEANRLSADNLAVLFDLCNNLDLQLIIAAPEVAQSIGNTTYRLVRQLDEHGHEDVVVQGRRVVAA